MQNRILLQGTEKEMAMQLQIECNHTPQQQSCWICKQLIEMTEAKVIVCNEQGYCYGEVCPKCLKKGFQWLSGQFEQLNQQKATVPIRQTRNRQIPIGA